MLLQPDSFIVEVIRQPEPTRDISLDVIVGMFGLAGALLAMAAVGSVVAGVVMVLIRRVRAGRPPAPEQSARRFRI